MKSLYVCNPLIIAGSVSVIIGLSYIANEPTSYLSLTPTGDALAAKANAHNEAYTAQTPQLLVIPTLHIRAAIQSVGLARDGSLGVPTNFTDVALYNGGPTPGELGSAVIDGHLSGIHAPHAVFRDLHMLAPGDFVEVIETGSTTLRFVVIAVRTYSKDEPTEDVFAPSSTAKLNLITCAGAWLSSEHLYSERTVVFTQLVATLDSPE